MPRKNVLCAPSVSYLERMLGCVATVSIRGFTSSVRRVFGTLNQSGREYRSWHTACAFYLERRRGNDERCLSCASCDAAPGRSLVGELKRCQTDSLCPRKRFGASCVMIN